MLKDFFDGVTSYGKAFFVIGRMHLWRYLMIPGLISLILGASLVYSAYLMLDEVAFYLALGYPSEWWGHDFYVSIARILSGIVLTGAGLFAYRVLLMGLISPFMTPLAAKVQEYITGEPVYDPPFFSVTNFKLILRGIYLSLRNVIKELWYSGWLLVLALIPVVGFAAPILLFLVQAFYAGFGNMDYSLEKYYNVKESKDFSKRYRWLAIGNGTVFLTILAVPIVGLFLAPGLATVAATLETMKRVNAPLIELESAKVDDFI